MIHYILIPTEERHSLRNEYRMRLVIVAFLFISIAMSLGIICLIPAFSSSSEQEKEALIRQQVIQKSRQESGATEIENELVTSQAIAAQIISEQNPLVYSPLIQTILSHKPKDLQITSFTIYENMSTTTLADVSIGGKAALRDSLLNFKSALDGDTTFSSVELPLEDIAKSKNVDFTITFKVNRKTKK